MGLRVFIDLKDLPLEDFFPTELLEAMTSASLYVAIFSTPYAQSPWCLADLALMLKSGTIISPICYLVQPDVRHLVHEKGIHAADLLKHQKKGVYSTDKLEEWKLVLLKALFYKGENINNNGQKQRVLKNIVSRVWEVMKRARLDVAKHHEAIEEVSADFETTVGESTKAYPDVQIVGIRGMGGPGKITLPENLSNV
ncbi:hypothetical protein SUGI_0712650 [Cryptomeria japonica]|uniref:disease resistance protein RUN1 n=1 Tax=Cryptomeria japonica TaxID=3369 RepID=UPI0024146D88|nr:disease resistance protein RUN1 [Cryptomeria japonica]GLJ35434.1 hypothetical protein SUGI_0712650 [Cryptomeria japonica]